MVTKAKGFNFYSDLAHFEKDIHNVDLGESYLTGTACAEMVTYLSKSILLNNITEPLNENRINYYSVMSDGSSSAKTMDEKQLFVIKTATTGVPKLSVMSLEEVADSNAEGLKRAFEHSIGKLNLTVRREDKELGLCTDGAPVNVRCTDS